MSNNKEFHPSGFKGEISQVHIMGDTRSKRMKSLSDEFPSQDMNLSDMARWAMHYLIHNLRKELDYEARFYIRPLSYPPAPTGYNSLSYPGEWETQIREIRKSKAPTGHDFITYGDTDVRMGLKFMYMRDMCDSKEGIDHEEGLRRRIRGYIREDGFVWVPPYHYMIEEYWKTGISVVSPWATGLVIINLVEFYKRTGDANAIEQARKMVMALYRLASWDTGRAYYEGGSGPWLNGKWISCSQGTIQHGAIRPIVHYWEITRDSESLDFALALADGMIDDLQPDLGDNRINKDGSFLGHSFCHLHAVWGIAYLGAMIRNPRYIEWAKRVYDFMVSQGSDFGWFPEMIGDQYGHTRSETCVVSDMVTLAALLAKAGYPGYWDHVERYVRNYIREAQFFVTPEFAVLYRSIHSDNTGRAEEGLRLLKEFEGGFVGAIRPNDWVIPTPTYWETPIPLPVIGHFEMDMMGCCSAGGMHALYTAWANAVTESAEGVFVNLSFNRESSQAKVVSFFPEQGRLTVVTRKETDFYLRPPSWTHRKEVKAYRNCKPVEPFWKGDYIKFSKAKEGEELTIIYPLISFTQKVTLPWLGNGSETSKDFNVKWVGNRVVGIEPGGRFLPMFTKVPRKLPAYP
ncbi:MAG: hypothetical protein HY606_09495 [Planctomycetes bacterium]|nr:hypothetical protein [Planctomycetota bacterium]